MRHTRFPTLLGLLVAALAAGCGDAPTGVSPASARITANGTAPLAVHLYCSVLSSTWYDCIAYGSGGSGSGYSFTWTNASEYFDDEDYGHSWAGAECPRYGPYISLTVTVRDSNGATATASRSLPCPAYPGSYY